ncbi:MAG: M24 family metallopeptidase [Candidatus Heimdallarchaeaceae archaeon]
MNLVKEKIEQAISILQELDIDMWLTYVRKTSEIKDPSLFFLIGDQWLTWQTALILTKHDLKIAVVSRYDVPNIEELGVYTQVIGYDTGIKEPLLEVIKSINPQRIAINYSADNVAADGLTHGMFIKLKRILENTPYAERLISSEGILAALRGRKTTAEIERIKRAIEISQSGHNRIRAMIKEGITEKQVAQMLDEHNKEHGVTYAYPPLINVGPETTIGHGKPSSSIKVRPGYLINIDYGVFVDGYASDIQRLSYVLKKGEDEPPEEVQKAFNTCIKAITAGAEILKPGVKGWEVDDAARKIITEAGYPEFKHALGHQVGINVHDGGCLLGPRWEKYGSSPELLVEEGQIFTLELHIFVEGCGYCSIEDMVQVTSDGCEFLSDRQTELYLIKLQ